LIQKTRGGFGRSFVFFVALRITRCESTSGFPDAHAATLVAQVKGLSVLCGRLRQVRISLPVFFIIRKTQGLVNLKKVHSMMKDVEISTF
jgi:hypothetical protein